MAKGNMNGFQALSLWTQLGISLAGPIVLGAVAGRFLDEKLHTGMLLSIILLAVGIAVGISGAYGMVRDIIRMQQGNEDDKSDKNDKK